MYNMTQKEIYDLKKALDESEKEYEKSKETYDRLKKSYTKIWEDQREHDGELVMAEQIDAKRELEHGELKYCYEKRIEETFLEDIKAHDYDYRKKYSVFFRLANRYFCFEIAKLPVNKGTQLNPISGYDIEFIDKKPKEVIKKVSDVVIQKSEYILKEN